MLMEGEGPLGPSRTNKLIYYAGQIANGGTTGSVVDDPPCTYTVTRGEPIVRDSTDMFATFIQLAVNGSLYLPLWRPQIQVGQPDINLTIYSVTLGATWTGLPAPPAAVTLGAAAGSRTFFIQAFNVAGVPTMAPAAVVIPAGPPVPLAAFPAVVTAAVVATLAALPPTPWGAGGTFSINPAGQLLYTPPVGTTDLLSFDFGSPANPVAAERADAASMMGALQRVYTCTGPLVPLPFDNFPNGDLSAVVTSPAFLSQQFVQWVPEDVSDTALPGPPTVMMDTKTNPEYYHAFSYEHIARIFNAALATAVDAIQAQFLAWWATLGVAPSAGLRCRVAPVLEWEPASKTYVLVAPSIGYGSARTSAQLRGPFAEENWDVSFNTNAYNLFMSFPAVFNVVAPGNSGRDVTLTLGAGTAAGAGLLAFKQGFSSVDAFLSPVASIGVKSTFLSALPQLKDAPVAVGASNVGAASNATTQSFDTTVVDFSLGGTAASDARTSLTYAPVAEYRLMQLKGGAIVNLDLQIGWTDRLTGEFTELLLPPQASASFVIAFIHASLL